LILDEPTAGVDVELRRDLWELITDLNDEGTTILLTTHYIEEAEQLCDRVAIMNQGRKVEEATPAELMERGTDTIEVGIAEPPATAPSLDIEGVHSTTMDGDTMLVTAAGGSTLAPAVMRNLESCGYTVTSLDVRRASLEEVFVDLTRDDDQAPVEVTR
jgi:ABC-2 type transport system ATP-binding protein